MATGRGAFHLYADVEFVVAASQNDVAHRTHVTVIAAPSERDVTERRNQIVGRIEVQQAGTGTIHRHPGMRRIRADQSRTPWRRVGPQISAHVPGGKAQRSQARDLQLREVLTDTPPVAKRFVRGCPYVGCFGIEAQILINSFGEIKQGVGEGPFLEIQRHVNRRGSRNLLQLTEGTTDPQCSEMLKVLPSGSLNQATRAPPGDVQIPNSSCSMPA